MNTEHRRREMFRGGFREPWLRIRMLGVRQVENDSLSQLEAGGVSSQCDAPPQARTSTKHWRLVKINCPTREPWEADEGIKKINKQPLKKRKGCLWSAKKGTRTRTATWPESTRVSMYP